MGFEHSGKTALISNALIRRRERVEQMNSKCLLEFLTPVRRISPFSCLGIRSRFQQVIRVPWEFHWEVAIDGSTSKQTNNTRTVRTFIFRNREPAVAFSHFVPLPYAHGFRKHLGPLCCCCFRCNRCLVEHRLCCRNNSGQTANMRHSLSNLRVFTKVLAFVPSTAAVWCSYRYMPRTTT